jgi:hypothetical protein
MVSKLNLHDIFNFKSVNEDRVYFLGANYAGSTTVKVVSVSGVE